VQNLAAVALAPNASERRDLTDPAQGPHALQRMLRVALEAIAPLTACAPILDRASAAVAPTVTLSRSLGAHAGASALVVRPRAVGDGPSPHHEVELWWVRRDGRLGLRELGRWIGDAMASTARGFTVSATAASVAHASEGRAVDVRLRGKWVTVATGGVVDPVLLRDAGLPDDATGLVLTLDLDRLVLLAKGIDDRALLTARDPAIAAQMLDLEPFIPPALARRLVLVEAGTR
jgi:phenylalanyl-tRNA synthetase alpha chain